MPNYIKNKIVFNCSEERLNEVFSFIKGERGDIDFQKIIPMPKTFLEYDTTNHPNGAGIADVDMKLKFIQATKFQKDVYGIVGWYDWAIFHWGTKWNASDAFREGNAVWFTTAWNGVPDIVQMLVELFPDVDVEYAFADEDYGYNVGTGYSEDGEFYFSMCEGGSDDAYHICFDLWGCEDLFEKVDGEWRYKESIF